MTSTATNQNQLNETNTNHTRISSLISMKFSSFLIQILCLGRHLEFYKVAASCDDAQSPADQIEQRFQLDHDDDDDDNNNINNNNNTPRRKRALDTDQLVATQVQPQQPPRLLDELEHELATTNALLFTEQAASAIARERAIAAERSAAALHKQLLDERQLHVSNLALVRDQAIETLRRQAEQLDQERSRSASLHRQLNVKRARLTEPPITPPTPAPAPTPSIIVLFTGFARGTCPIRQRYADAMTQFGATVLDNVGEHEFPSTVTHVVAGSGRTTKVLVALLRHVPVVQGDWIDASIAANQVVPFEPYARRLTTSDPLLGKTVHLTSSFLNSAADVSAAYTAMAHELCIAGKVRAVLEGDLPPNYHQQSHHQHIDYTIVGEDDETASPSKSRLTFRQFVKLIDR